MIDIQPTNSISVNQLAQPLVVALLNDAATHNLGISKHNSGAIIVDAGIDVAGGLEAGRRIAEICMGGLGQVTFTQQLPFKHWPTGVQVSAKRPVLACLGSQYAGWTLSCEKFFSLGSGPARSIAQREDLFKDIDYKDKAKKTVLVLEADRVPPLEVIEKVARDTLINPENLTFILTPTRSLAGTVQIVARVLEVALHKLHTLHFPLNQLVDGIASAPLPSPSSDFLTGMGRTNDAILFGGFVHLFVQCSDEAAKQLAADLPSSASKDYGKPFAQVFKEVNMDFYQIDPLLFSPAKVAITNLTTGNSYFAGAFDEDILNQSFGA